MVLQRSAVSLALGSLLLLAAADACVLTAPDLGAPLRELRAQQRAQVERLSDLFCTTYYDCGCTETYPIYEGHAECIEHITDLMLGHLEQGINEELTYDPSCLDANIAMLEDLGCTVADDVIAGSTVERLLAAATECRTYDGDLALGEECAQLPSTRGDECGPGLTCDDDFAMCVDTVIAQGEPCGDDERRCEQGLVCGWASSAEQRHCLPPVSTGNSCALVSYCEHDSYCDEDYVCRPLPGVGEACVEQIGPDPCAAGHRCIDGVCELGAGEGEPCGTCRLGLTCSGEGGCVKARPLICEREDQLP